jgi:hypothetical protein
MKKEVSLPHPVHREQNTGKNIEEKTKEDCVLKVRKKQ